MLVIFAFCFSRSSTSIRVFSSLFECWLNSPDDFSFAFVNSAHRYFRKAFMKLSAKLLISFMCGFMSLLCFFCASFHSTKVSHRLRYFDKGGKKHFWGSEKRTKNILSGFSPIPMRNRNEILFVPAQMLFVPAEWLRKQTPKAWVSSWIDLFHRKIRKINLKSEKKFHYGKFEFSLIFAAFFCYRQIFNHFSTRLVTINH